MPRKIEGYGWVPDLPDGRDLLYAAPLKPQAKLPDNFDLRKSCPKIYNQGALGSCTANAIAAALEFDQLKQRLKNVFTPSRLFIYYNERAMEGSIKSDSGAMLRDGVKSVAKRGACSEASWPYEIARFRDKPSRECYARGPQPPGDPLPAPQPVAGPAKGLPGGGVPLRLRLRRLRGLREPPRGRDRRSRDAACERGIPRRPRGAGGGLRRADAALHRPQLVGHEMGQARLLHDALPLPAADLAVAGLLDEPQDRGDRDGNGRARRWRTARAKPSRRCSRRRRARWAATRRRSLPVRDQARPGDPDRLHPFQLQVLLPQPIALEGGVGAMRLVDVEFDREPLRAPSRRRARSRAR